MYMAIRNLPEGFFFTRVSGNLRVLVGVGSGISILATINCVLTELAFAGRPVTTRFTVEIVVLIPGEYECE
ncbi:hypothetical protein TVAG_214770 [Trichomonas vaginalis G3]|nr:hypothetical protein TVAGG3_0824830 [Trichomonas vaginalis G3]XP_001296722.1 hypothetical protein TVAGG3_0331700 [Trichomonas vaginalis G3]XP_001580238.1 hypothetical protein TVAGG3_0170790 [Trichomonas vaginalis G3]XP_051076647.1 uncharacterized protein TVAGG3_1064550 [Trichomonas vaginalis G3]XP_051103833.1 hypothetical protein TVAGG3_0437850 [Trichomonas vaginalis G3]EAX68643.1 hypothetical protein TVAG_580190 [Trichomonas vaginalis G3]EAX69750.1 hypothetical protein TVAG_527240 [Tricho|eukprot:XP_001281573.1 hypothetical protein [Trichomonas vaginalis G3]